MIHSDLDMWIALIHLVVKMPENYYSSLLQGFFRNSVCLFSVAPCDSIPCLKHNIFPVDCCENELCF